VPIGSRRFGKDAQVAPPHSDPERIHVVMLDDDFFAGYFTTDRADYDAAVEILIEAMGHDRVSGFTVEVTDLADWRSTVERWSSDPRIVGDA
jgi:hypothetical protein